MCDTFFKKSKQDHVEKLFINESFNTKECFLKLTKASSDYIRDISADVLSIIKYPKANLHYAFSEDTHPTKRIITVSKLFEEQKLLSHSASCKERLTNQDFNLEDEAVNQYIRTEPPSFVIFGKPGSKLGINLASAIADSWNCVLISPISLIQQEIDTGTEKGQYMERILRCGKAIKSEIVMNLIRCRIKKRDIKHRGYVIECLPFIPGDTDFDNSSDSCSIVNMDHTCPEFCENAADENYETHEARITSNNAECKTEFKYEQEISRQIDEMFTVWPRKPLIIIYLVCPKQDVASTCARWHKDISTGNYIFEENEFTHPFDDEYDERDDSDTSYDFSQVANDRLFEDLLTCKFNVIECDRYQQLALPVIDKWILAHDPQYVIRVDGRSSTRRALQILQTRLSTLALQPSILPKKMIEQDDIHIPETSAEINLSDELAEKSTEEIFEILRQREIVSFEFPWKLSAWKFYCPVALAQGRTVKGLPKRAVRFLSKIFFFSSEEAVNLFVENPRTFLLPPNPRPTCKIAVFGPKYSGKSKLSARLAEVFGGIVINVDEIMKKSIKQREESSNKKLYENDSNVQISLKSVDRSVGEKADIIIQNIKEIPDVKLEDELQRDGGYVVDGMCVDVEVWRKIVDDANIVFEDIIVLFENEPYAYLLNKFRNFFYLYNSEHETNYDIEEDHEEYKTLHENAEWEYLEHLTRFESEWTKFEEQIEFAGNVIKCNLADIQDVPEYIINHIKSRFDTSVSAAGKDEAKEIQQEEVAVAEIETNLATENVEERKSKRITAYNIDLETAEQLLDCGYYFFSAFGRWCPVQLYTSKIPVQMFLPMKARGQIFPVRRHPYIYFLAGEEALATFLNDPSKYLTLDCRPSLIPLRIVVIGPPNCGKTTLANRFAKTYGMKHVVFQFLIRGSTISANILSPLVPAFLHVMDIAGLVKGAAEGQGLGNSFLSHIGACDGIFHLCRAFEDDDVTHVEGDVNPVRDLDIISEELRLKDVEFLNVHLEKLGKLVLRGNDKKLKPEYETLLKVKGVLADDKKHIRFADWSANDIEILNKYLFLTSKPILYLVNLSEKDYIRKKNKWLIKIKEWVDQNDPGAVLIPFSGAFENKILDMDEAERAKYFEEHKVTSALDKIIVQGYKALQLQYFFTAGHDEVKAWTIQKGARAPQAAGKIHTDFEKGFIMAEVMKFDDFKNEGTEAAVKAAGKYRQQGRSYIVEDGDIIFFKFNAGAGLKDAKKK